uniref:Solute carrier organic anion transporter family member n=1 Tax=Sphenodon punctatus TaxID=8508 RepID=A0A8D0L2T1_SPHPU
MTAALEKTSCEDQLRRTGCKSPFLSIKFFVLCHSFLQLCQLQVSGYVKGSVSTIEKRYGLSSQTSGLMVSFNEVGNTLLIIFVSYFGSRVHRPRFIGCGALLVSLAAFLISLPHFITGIYEYDKSIASDYSNVTDICQPGPDGTARLLRSSACTPHAAKENRAVLSILFLGQALLGVGGVPIQPFGISFIDDFASKRNSPLYLGILFAVTVIGPGIAFMLGSATLRFYVDIDKVPTNEIHITNKDPRWVGAWWLGFLVAASLVALSAIPYFFFPREMPKEVVTTKESDVQKGRGLLNELKSSAETPQNLSLSQFIKMFPQVLLRNLRNPIFVLVILAQVNLSAMVAGLATFMGKFLERQFSLTASLANMILGSVNVPGAMIGIVMGGIIMKNFHMTLKQCSALCILSMLLCMLFGLPLIFLGCPTQKIAGLDYTGRSEVGRHVLECNRRCNCPSSAFNPVCGLDGIEYVSPCDAGCEAVNIESDSIVVNYTRCSCIIVNGTEGVARPGSCDTNCFHFLIPFIILCCLAGILASITHTPSFMLILRSVQPEDKSIAIGIQFLMLRVLAWMPGPVLYGSVIDTTCLLWEKKCDVKASCRYYNNTLLRQRYLGLQLLFEVGCFLCFVTVYFILRQKENKSKTRTEPKESPEKEGLALKQAEKSEKISVSND